MEYIFAISGMAVWVTFVALLGIMFYGMFIKN